MENPLLIIIKKYRKSKKFDEFFTWYCEFSTKNFKNIDLKVLKEKNDAIFNEKKSHGIYFTKKFIVEFIVKRTIGKYLITKQQEITNLLNQKSIITDNIEEILNSLFSLTICDPACGNGYFLIEVFFSLYEFYVNIDEILNDSGIYREISEIFKRVENPTPLIINQNLFGVDLNEISVTFCKTFFQSISLISNSNQVEINIKTGNSLLLDWKSEFPEVFNQKMDKSGFDFIIGNPPYVRVHKQRKELKEALRKIYYCPYKDFDIYIVFFELGFKLLKTGGILAFITSDKFLVRLYAKKIRELILKNGKILELIDISRIMDIFPENIYPIISIIKNEENSDGDHNVTYHKINENYKENLNALANSDKNLSHKEVLYTTTERQLSFLHSQHHQLIFIQDKFKAIIGALSKFAKFNKIIPEIDIFCGTPRAKDYKKWGDYVEDFPNGCKKSMKYLVSKSLFPYQIKWGENTIRSIGKQYSHPFFCIDDPPFSSNKLRCFREKPKILIRANAKKLIAAIDNEGYVFNGVYAIIPNKEDCYFLLSLLNSNLINFYFTLVNQSYMVHGNYFSINKAQLLDLPLYETNKGDLSLFFEKYFNLLYLLKINPEFDEPYEFFQNRLLDFIIYELYFEKELKNYGFFTKIFEEINRIINNSLEDKRTSFKLVEILKIKELKEKVKSMENFPWIKLIENKMLKI